MAAARCPSIDPATDPRQAGRRPGRLDVTRALRALLGCGIAAAGLLGCGNWWQGNTTGTTATETVAPSASTASLPTRPQAFTAKQSDGSRFTGELAFSAMIPASRADKIASAFPSGLPCPDVDPTRDALIFGTITFHNETPKFTPQLRAHFSPLVHKGDRLYPLEIGVGFADKPTCTGKVGKTGKSVKLRPQFSSRDWGPVPLQIVVRGVYSPRHPKGDPKVVASMTFNVSGTVTSKGALLRFEPQGAGRSKTSAATVDLVHYGPP
jgi:hypothetical protein